SAHSSRCPAGQSTTALAPAATTLGRSQAGGLSASLSSDGSEDRRMSVICVDWETAHLYGRAWISHHQLRYRVFAERRHWDVPSHNDLEYDQFDTPAAKYLVWLDAGGVARGVTRLI